MSGIRAMCEGCRRLGPPVSFDVPDTFDEVDAAAAAHGWRTYLPDPGSPRASAEHWCAACGPDLDGVHLLLASLLVVAMTPEPQSRHERHNVDE